MAIATFQSPQLCPQHPSASRAGPSPQTRRVAGSRLPVARQVRAPCCRKHLGASPLRRRPSGPPPCRPSAVSLGARPRATLQ